ncbi:unnamed protein product [Adineta steineri]|uniref:Uncharacterized protein n=1 Tax=Adineta steineri TaxID=433720 RepID=A0A819U1E1_9BILA|nr:unnamed protein product [Adineta steineri]
MDNIVGSIEQKHFTEQRRRSIVIDYLITTSTHGLRSVGRAYSTCNRIFWIVISAILQYFAYPTQTKVEINLDLSMDFPAVTICSATPNRYDRVNISLINFFYRLFPSYVKFNQSILNSLVLPLYMDLFNRNQIKEWQSTGYQLADIMLYCNYNEIDCSNAFIPSISSIFGNCYTFNWKTSIPFFALNSVSNTFVLRQGLSLGFYIPRESYFPTLSYDAGLVVLLHDNDELPLPNENGLYLQPGLSHSIIYRKSKTTFLPAPYSQCTSNIADDLLTCAFNSEQKLVASEELQTLWCTHCAPQCQLLNGTNKTNILVPDDFAQRFDYYFERNYLKVFIGCGIKYVTKYKQEAKLSFVDTFSAIGGQTGLWIGLSVLSVIELIELLYRLVHKLIIQ